VKTIECGVCWVSTLAVPEKPCLGDKLVVKDHEGNVVMEGFVTSQADWPNTKFFGSVTFNGKGWRYALPSPPIHHSAGR
jgi:hypothetical protein